jgi:hypothetical protein
MDAKFEIEGELENDQEEVEEEEQEEESRSIWAYILLAVFILLFLVSSSLLVYFQFYKGQGQFEWSLQKRGASVSDTSITYYKLQRDSSLTQLDSLKNIIASSSSLFTTNTTGEVYYVQIGAFKNINFTKYSANMVNMFVEVADGMNKLIIGGFTNFDDACSFRKDIVRIGIKGAFIVKKVNGERVKFSQWCN